MLTGRRPEAGPDLAGRPEYDPAVTTLRQRELAKVAELEAAGRKVALATVQRLRLGYERQGLRALVDGRAVRVTPVAGRADPRVVEAIRQAIGEDAEPVDWHGEQAAAQGQTLKLYGRATYMSSNISGGQDYVCIPRAVLGSKHTSLTIFFNACNANLQDLILQGGLSALLIQLLQA